MRLRPGGTEPWGWRVMPEGQSPTCFQNFSEIRMRIQEEGNEVAMNATSMHIARDVGMTL